MASNRQKRQASEELLAENPLPGQRRKLDHGKRGDANQLTDFSPDEDTSPVGTERPSAVRSERIREPEKSYQQVDVQSSFGMETESSYQPLDAVPEYDAIGQIKSVGGKVLQHVHFQNSEDGESSYKPSADTPAWQVNAVGGITLYPTPSQKKEGTGPSDQPLDSPPQEHVASIRGGILRKVPSQWSEDSEASYNPPSDYLPLQQLQREQRRRTIPEPSQHTDDDDQVSYEPDDITPMQPLAANSAQQTSREATSVVQDEQTHTQESTDSETPHSNPDYEQCRKRERLVANLFPLERLVSMDYEHAECERYKEVWGYGHETCAALVIKLEYLCQSFFEHIHLLSDKLISKEPYTYIPLRQKIKKKLETDMLCKCEVQGRCDVQRRCDVGARIPDIPFELAVKYLYPRLSDIQMARVYSRDGLRFDSTLLQSGMVKVFQEFSRPSYCGETQAEFESSLQKNVTVSYAMSDSELDFAGLP